MTMKNTGQVSTHFYKLTFARQRLVNSNFSSPLLCCNLVLWKDILGEFTKGKCNDDDDDILGAPKLVNFQRQWKFIESSRTACASLWSQDKKVFIFKNPSED